MLVSVAPSHLVMSNVHRGVLVRRALGISGATVLLMACFWTLQLTWIEGMTPNRAGFSPADSHMWIERGLAAESAGDFAPAEQDYREAARASRQFQPAWTLANYYFRRGNLTEFHTWAAKALAMSFGDPRPLFRLCWNAEPAPGRVLDAASRRPDVMRQYLAYLTAEGKLAAAGEAANRIMLRLSADDLPELLTYCGRLLETGAGQQAVNIWNGLCRRRAIPYDELAPDQRLSLTNGDFRVRPSSLGFDWRVIPWAGITLDHLATQPGVRITFSGEEPESCEIITQRMPVIPGAAYRIQEQHRTANMQAETGIRWSAYDDVTHLELARSEPLPAGETWMTQTLRFAAGSNCRLVKLALIYQRTPGTTRLEGSLWLRQVQLD